MSNPATTALQGPGRLCAICQGPLGNGEPVRTCDACGTAFHAACWAGNEGCGTYGCRNAPVSLKVVLAQESQSGAWGDTKVCPKCGQVLEAAALKCPHCKAAFETRAPMSAEDYRAQLERAAAARRTAWLAALLFVASAFGILAPLTFAAGAAWIALRWPAFSRRAAGVAELLVYGSLVLSLAHGVLLILVFGLGW